MNSLPRREDLICQRKSKDALAIELYGQGLSYDLAVPHNVVRDLERLYERDLSGELVMAYPAGYIGGVLLPLTIEAAVCILMYSYNVKWSLDAWKECGLDVGFEVYRTDSVMRQRAV